MKSQQKALIAVIVLVAVLVVGSAAYNALSDSVRAAQKADAPAASSQVAADFTVTDAAGQNVEFSEHLGKPVVVNFWASWCGPCMSELPAYEEMYALYGDQVDFMMVNLTDGARETVASATDAVKDGAYTFPVYFDTEQSAVRAYGVSSIPLSVLVNANGVVIDQHLGAMTKEALESFIMQAL